MMFRVMKQGKLGAELGGRMPENECVDVAFNLTIVSPYTYVRSYEKYQMSQNKGVGEYDERGIDRLEA